MRYFIRSSAIWNVFMVIKTEKKAGFDRNVGRVDKPLAIKHCPFHDQMVYGIILLPDG